MPSTNQEPGFVWDGELANGGRFGEVVVWAIVVRVDVDAAD